MDLKYFCKSKGEIRKLNGTLQKIQDMINSRNSFLLRIAEATENYSRALEEIYESASAKVPQELVEKSPPKKEIVKKEENPNPYNKGAEEDESDKANQDKGIFKAFK